MKNRSAVSITFIAILVIVSTLSFQLGAAFADDWGNTGSGELLASSPLQPPFTVLPQCGRILLIDNWAGDGKASFDAFGYTYTLLNSPSAINSESFAPYKTIFITWGQKRDALVALNARKADLAKYLSCGGGLIVNAQYPFAFVPGSFTASTPCPESVELVDTTHPLAQGLTNALLSNWMNSTHSSIISWPAAARVIARCANNPSKATILGMPYGLGRMVVTGIDPEWHLINYNLTGAWQLMYNELRWACCPSCHISDCINPPVEQTLLGPRGSGGVQSTPSTISQPQPVGLAAISVKTASLSAGKVAPGTPVTVTANVANTGTVNGATRVTLYVNGQEESSQGITVSSGSNMPVTFSVSRNEPGKYSVFVNGVSTGSFEVDPFTNNDILIYGVIAVFVLGIACTLYMITRRRAV